MIEKFKQIIKNDFNRLVSIRRDIHSHPEIGLQEFETSKLLSKVIQDLGFDVTFPYVLDTGFILITTFESFSFFLGTAFPLEDNR